MPPKPIPPELKSKTYSISMPPDVARALAALSPRGISDGFAQVWQAWTFAGPRARAQILRDRHPPAPGCVTQSVSMPQSVAAEMRELPTLRVGGKASLSAGFRIVLAHWLRAHPGG